MWTVYCHKHKETGKRYYGITSNLKKRWAGSGWHHDDATKRKISESNKGRVHSEDQNKAHSEWMQGRFVGSKNHKSIAVRCTTTGTVYESQCIAAKETGCDQSKIWACCNGKRNHTHGLKWEYVKEL